MTQLDTNKPSLVSSGELQANGLGASAIDLSERAKTQILNGILQNIPVIVFRINAEGLFTEAHGFGLRRLGIEDPSMIVGQPVLTGYPSVKNELEAALRGETVSCESHGVANGKPWWLQNYLFFDFVNGSGCIGFALDITELKQAEQNKERLELQMQHAQRLNSLGVLAGGIAHDFNNLLMGILGNCSLVMKTPDASDEVKDYMQQIHHAANKATEICRSMLDFCGKNKSIKEPISLVGVIKDLSSLLQVSVSKNVEFEFNLDADTPLIEANPSQLRQIIFNFVSNAAEAIGDRPGRIKISTSKTFIDSDFYHNTYLSSDLAAGECVVLEITDNGCGMSKDTISKIFDPFFTTKFTGRGLGLATVLGIARSHNAAIKCDSVVGIGTSFKVIFQCSKVAEIKREPKVKKHDPLPLITSQRAPDKTTILVADDDMIAQSVIVHMLGVAGYNVLVANDGEEAVEVFEQNKDVVDLVILDYSMPKLNGADVLAELRRLKPKQMVLMSSAYDRAIILSRLNAGLKPSSFIQKPYEFDDLLVVINSTFGEQTC